VKRIAAQAADTFVFTNNHFRGQAPANALELKSLITGQLVDIPAGLIRQYPELAKYSVALSREQQGKLF
jgi:hypothetical protein